MHAQKNLALHKATSEWWNHQRSVHADIFGRLHVLPWQEPPTRVHGGLSNGCASYKRNFILVSVAESETKIRGSEDPHRSSHNWCSTAFVDRAPLVLDARPHRLWWQTISCNLGLKRETKRVRPREPLHTHTHSHRLPYTHTLTHPQQHPYTLTPTHTHTSTRAVRFAISHASKCPNGQQQVSSVCVCVCVMTVIVLSGQWHKRSTEEDAGSYI